MHGVTTNPNKALWEKGDFTRGRSNHARERRGSRQSVRDNQRAKGFGSRMR